MSVTILHGDCVEQMRGLADGSVQCVVTSPPYFGLRSYLPEGHPDKAREIGLEQTPADYVARMVEVFREVRRVLAEDGTLWLNIGDSYASPGGKSGAQTALAKAGANSPTAMVRCLQERAESYAERPKTIGSGLKPKDLIGIPWRVAFALQEDGWYLRQDVIWQKPNPMPESVRDRCTKAHEYLFLLSKSERYFYDAAAIKEPAVSDKPAGNKTHKYVGTGDPKNATKEGLVKLAGVEWETRNRRSVWTVATRPYRGAHFATMPPELAAPCILAGTSERGHCPACGARWARVIERRDADSTGAAIGGDPSRNDGGTRERAPAGSGGGNVLAATRRATGEWAPGCSCGLEPVPDVVLDPFGGSGTTAAVALQHGRRAVLCELNAEYLPLISDRIAAVQAATQRPTKPARRKEPRTQEPDMRTLDLFGLEAA